MSVTRINGADYVIEQGTGNGYFYRKWASGTLECWCSYSASIAVNIASKDYGGYRSALIVMPAYPVGFTSAPVVMATMGANSQGVYVLNMTDSNATQPKGYLACHVSVSAATRSFYLYAIGRWK